MKRRFRCVVLILLLCLLTVFMFNVAYAGDVSQGPVSIAKAAEENTKRRADTAYDEMRNANILYSAAKSEYDKNQAKINRGAVVTSATLLAATFSVYMSGTLTAPIAVSALVQMLDLGDAIKDSTHLESAYETAIGEKVSRIGTFEFKVGDYNTAYNNYILALAMHTGWTSEEVLAMIGDGKDPEVTHKDSVTSSDSHGGYIQNTWASYDKSLPSYTCLGLCSDTFSLPSAARTSHKKKCGGPNNVSLINT